MRILLGQLGSNGDCLYATTIARQIKADYPGCHLTWAISSLARRVIDNNPDVDAIWEVPLTNWADMETTWRNFASEAHRRRERQEFDAVFLTQIYPDNFRTYDGTIRPSLFRNYPLPITVPIETVISLTEEEKMKVDAWFLQSSVSQAANIVIFECSSKSGQSFITPNIALKIAHEARKRDPTLGFVLSSHENIISEDPLVVSGAALSVRETARLTFRASLFVGCGSGLTVVATSAAAKPNLPNIQILNASTSVYASFRHDFDYFGKSSDHFIEMTCEDPIVIAEAIVMAVQEGVPLAKLIYESRVEVDFAFYLRIIDWHLLRHGCYWDVANSLELTAERYGWTEQLLDFAQNFCAEATIRVPPDDSDDQLRTAPGSPDAIRLTSRRSAR